MLALGVPTDGAVCQACRRDVTKAVSDSNFLPRWTKSTNQKGCCIAGCSQVVYASLHKEIHNILDGLHLKSSVHVGPSPMCKHHYHMVYNSIHPTQYKCVTCDQPLQFSTSKFCPNPVKITEHLRDNAGFQGSIRANDKVCYHCYKSHLYILKSRKTRSTDRDLKELISLIEQNMPTSVTSIGDLIDVTLQKLAVKVGRELLEGNALLLPDVQDWFCSFAEKVTPPE